MKTDIHARFVVALLGRQSAVLFATLLGLWVSLFASDGRAQTDCTATGTTGIPQTECEALLALYIAADGTNWTKRDGWDTASAISTWYGVTVSAGRVTELSLYFNQLAGPIPPQLGNLANLDELSLGNNRLSGTIPGELGNLGNLTRLALFGNDLTGAIPTELGNLSSLEQLHFGNNQLNGTIPVELGNLANLTELNLFGNRLTGTIPSELSNLSSLTILSVSNNRLRGAIPTEFGNLANLTRLHLDGNQLTGVIPTELGNLSNLTELRIMNNGFTGTIPVELANLTRLTGLWLSNNQLTGTIPPELGNLVRLESLQLSNNMLTGTIPTEFGNLVSLRTVYIGPNQLTGTIPPELGNLANLETLALDANQFSGAIPPELGNLGNLEYLSMWGNELTGSIPSELGNLSSLESLRLSNNELTGSIPPELGNLGNLESLYLDTNQLSGAIPVELTTLPKLASLQVSANQLSGDIPDLSGLPLTWLVLTDNAFVFEDLETEFPAYSDGTPATFRYSPQANVDTARTVNFPSGGPAVLPAAVAANPSGNDLYQWYKDDAPIAAPEGTSRDLDVTLGSNTATPAHEGTYYYTISNTVVTGLVLTSEQITVAVTATCGDGIINVTGEACDDGNLIVGDGCNAACLLEVGEPCTDDAECVSNRCDQTATPAICIPAIGCGDGMRGANEGCDDGNNVDDDGCTAACQVENGFPCAVDSECASGHCDTDETPPICATPTENPPRGNNTFDNLWRGGAGCAVQPNSAKPNLVWFALFVALIARRRLRSSA